MNLNREAAFRPRSSYFLLPLPTAAAVLESALDEDDRRTSRLACPPAFSYRRAMRPLRALGIYIAVVFLGGALLVPWLYSLAQAWAGTVPQLAHQPFHRFVNRALLI